MRLPYSSKFERKIAFLQILRKTSISIEPVNKNYLENHKQIKTKQPKLELKRQRWLQKVLKILLRECVSFVSTFCKLLLNAIGN